MRSHAYVKVEERINILIYKNNAYVGDELRAFINEKLDEINRACDVISLDEEKIQKVQEYFMSQLENIAFMRAYLAKTFRVQSRHGSEVDREAFRQFIYKAVPALKKPETFVYEALGLQDRKNEIVRQIAEVKKEMNQYSGSNKKPILMQFNQAMDDLLRSIPQKTYFEVVAEARDKVKDALERAQSAENQHYAGMRFFASCRKSNSSMQPCINNAKEILEAMISVDSALSHEVQKPKRNNLTMRH